MSSLPPALRAFAPYPDFLRLLGARVMGGSATQMLMVAAAWQMYDLTGSAWDLGLVGLYQFAPVLVFTLLAGHVADRHARSRIIAGSMALQWLAAALLLAATVQGALSRELIFGVSVALGAARAFQMPAQQSLVGALLPHGLLSRGTAMSSAGNQVAVIGGPALAGLLYMGSGVTVYATCLGLLLVSITLALRMHAPRIPPSKEPVTLHSLLAGVRFVWQSKTLLGAVSLDLMAVLLGGATALLPIFAKDILHVGPAGLGALRAAPAVGALACSIALSHQPLRRHVGRWLFGCVAAYGVCMVVFGLSTSFVLSLAVLAVSGALDMVSVVVRQTLALLDTPDDIRGRVGAVNSIFIGASNQLGEFESGAVAAWIGPVGSVVAGGVGTLLVVAAWWKLFPSLARRDAFHA
ncbi:MFS transporter [Ramlibacter sp. MAHUQ-53]|uniref:MFS transporter n=1 Tax=unclassified Ramlibacter TaxID=2617605 RepID=UPI003635DB6D